jgi:CRP-like cAMP-binding protein
MSVLVPDDLIGVDALLTGPSPDLIEPCELMTIQWVSHSRVLDLAARDLNVALWLIWYISQENRRHEQWLTLLGQATALEKIPILLLDLDQRVSRGPGVPSRSTRIPLTQREIAEHLGLTLQHACRTLAVLRRRGALRSHYRAIEILNVGILQESAGDMKQLWQERWDTDQCPEC